ncbi:MAG: hypothetical protein WAK20_20755 [Candidatus Acidiferrum sp.]
MHAIYRVLLHLYPADYRDRCGEEMLSVLRDVDAENEVKGALAHAKSRVREVAGLLNGALQEHLRDCFGSGRNSVRFSRRFDMRSEFRFPKATVTLMALILAGILLTIDKAKSIQNSVPYANPHVGPIQPTQFALVPVLLVTLAGACIGGAISWGIVYALRRSGAQRLAELDLTTQTASRK